MNSNNELAFVYELYKRVHNDNLSYIYRGHFTSSLTDNIFSLAEQNIEKVENSPRIKKRVFFIMVEGLQNVTKHQDISVDENERLGLFVIQKRTNEYIITTGNIIENEKIAILKQSIDKINSLSKDELKAYSQAILQKGEMSEKSGAGLGLIEMARKSGRKLSYDFIKINDTHTYFYLNTDVSLTGDDSFTETDGANTIVLVKEIHTLLNQNNILLIFSGNFNQEGLLNLLSFIEIQVSGSIGFKKKTFHIMVEMIQNIVKHGTKGMLIIGRKGDDYYLYTGNLIETSSMEELKEKIMHVNNLVGDELDKYYNKMLLDFDIDDSKGAGLGLIDLRIKSDNPLGYQFIPLDNQNTFFTLKVTITKK